MTSLTAIDWDRFLEQYPNAHLLQTSAWGQFKSEFGWKVQRVSSGENGAQILFRPLPLGLSLGYIPKGPVGPNCESLWPEIDRVCRRMRAVILKVEPDQAEHPGDNITRKLKGFQSSEHSIQPRRTIIISLEGDEEQWLARMKQKTRYNIRLAEKKGVQVRVSNDVDTFSRLMNITGQRDGFGVHSSDYFQRVYEQFQPHGMCELLLAEYAGKPLAGLMVFARGKRAWYFYGASNDDERSRMPAYLLQWHAMRWAKTSGCSEYDLWGVPDEEEETLEAGFENRSDGLWGVYRFKRGFGGTLTRNIGAWDRSYMPLASYFYRWWVHRKGEIG
jgi:peptidoglycan pentaglycine glycine transferase (the first glycine)